jgi:hypothetical protein
MERPVLAGAFCGEVDCRRGSVQVVGRSKIMASTTDLSSMRLLPALRSGSRNASNSSAIFA